MLSAITAILFSSCNVSRKGAGRKGPKAPTEQAAVAAGGDAAPLSEEYEGGLVPAGDFGPAAGSEQEVAGPTPETDPNDGAAGAGNTGENEPDSNGDEERDDADDAIPWDDEPEAGAVPAAENRPEEAGDLPEDPLSAGGEVSGSIPGDEIPFEDESRGDGPADMPGKIPDAVLADSLPAAPADGAAMGPESPGPGEDDYEDFIDVDMEESTAGTFGPDGEESGGNMKVVDFEADIMRPINITEDSTALNLLGNVVFYHNGSVITCDSAVRYSEKRMDCFKRVIINNGTTYVYGDRAEYNGETNTARVYAPIVKMVDEDAVLYTYRFIFNTLTNIGRYAGGGVLTQNDNHMESERGYYNTDTREFTGAGAVELTNPDYKLVSDSVRYNLDTEVAEFFTPTQIWNEKGEILLADRGIYRNASADYEFTSNSYILTDNQEIWADTLIHNSLDDYTELRRDIQIIDEENNAMAFGDYGEYWGETEQGMLTLEPSLVSFDPESPADTLYMRSDSMFFYTYDYEVDFFREEESRLPEGESPLEELISGPGAETGPTEEPVTGETANGTGEEPLERELPGLVENPDGVGTRYELIVPPDEPGEPFDGDDLDSLTESGDIEGGELIEAAEELEYEKESGRSRRRDRNQPERQSRQERRAREAGNVDMEPVRPGFDGEPAESDGDNAEDLSGARPADGETSSYTGQAGTEGLTGAEFSEGVSVTPLTHQGGTADGELSAQGDTVITEGDLTGIVEGTDPEPEQPEIIEQYISPYAELSGMLYEALAGDSTGAEMSAARFWLQVRDEIEGDSLKLEYYTAAVADALASQTVDTTAVNLPSADAAGIVAALISESEAEQRSLPAMQPAEPQDSLQRVFYGYRNVRIYRDDFQAVCDSIVGFSKDSTLHLHIDPVLWTDQNQVVSDIMVIFTRDEQLYKAEFTGSPFMSSQVDEQRFNQIKGKFMVSWFRDNDIYRHDVFGNGQTYYYMEDDKTGEIDGFMTCECADITFFIEESQIDEIIYRLDPVYWIYPIDKIPPDVDQFLPGFKWEAHRRPLSKEDVHTRDIRPRRRNEVLAVPHPEFPITAELDETRERLINQNLWRDRNDRLSPQTLEFMRYVDLRDAEQALEEAGR